MSNRSDLRETLSLESPPTLDFDDIAASNSARSELQDTVIQAATSDVADQFKPISAIIYGPKGAGKRRLLDAAAGELGSAGYQLLRISSLQARDASQSEIIETAFKILASNQPATLVLNCFDKGVMPDAIRTLGRCIDIARKRGDDIAVLGMIDEDGMFRLTQLLRKVDAVVEAERPGLDARESILQDRLARIGEIEDKITPDSYDTRRLAREADRFGVEDIERFIRRIAVTATTDTTTESPLSEAEVASCIEQVDTERVEKVIDEDTLTDVDIPDVTFADVGGHEETKRRLREQVEQALTKEDVADRFGVEFGSGVLLHGPPGTGKTMLVRALANELDYTFIPVNSSLLKGRQKGSQRIPSLFYRAQRNAPSILFFDEFDLLGTQRGQLGEDSTVNTLLTELDGVEQLDQVMVIAATNRPKTLDPALLRPGRFDYHFEIGPPEPEVQADIFETHTQDTPLAADVTPAWFADLTSTVTGAEIAAVCERAVTIALRETSPEEVELGRAEFEQAYADFERGRLLDDDLTSSPTFQ